MLAIALTASALTTAAPVPVTGGTGRERAIVRHALAVLDPGAVTSARIDENHYLVLAPSTRRDPSAAYLRAQWEAQALVVSVAARFAAAGDRLAGYRVIGNCGHDASCGSGGSMRAAQAPTTGPPGARRVRATVLARAQAAGIDVRFARVLPIGGGILSVVVRLREEQLLGAGLAMAVTGMFGAVASARSPLHFLSIEAPDGKAVAYGGTYVNGGSWNPGGEDGNGAGASRLPGGAPGVADRSHRRRPSWRRSARDEAELPPRVRHRRAAHGRLPPPAGRSLGAARARDGLCVRRPGRWLGRQHHGGVRPAAGEPRVRRLLRRHGSALGALPRHLAVNLAPSRHV
jgi:hypothetical protein